MLFASHGKFPVKYEQIFAEKHIILTEFMSFSDRNLLQFKKGFVKYAQ
jgi:hypothetical protein